MLHIAIQQWARQKGKWIINMHIHTAFNDVQCTEYSVDLYNKSAKVYLW